jgi:soluble lytic murein transglycosylase-like protein
MIERDGSETHRRVGRLRSLFAPMLGLLVMVGTVYAGAPASGHRGPAAVDAATVEAGADALPELRNLETRVERVNQGWARLASYYDSEVAPVERVLLRYRSNDDELVGRIATAVVREAKAAGIQPRLLLAVLLVENPWLDPQIRSSVGAVGLMQVMPVHRGGWSCGYDLEDVDTNICLGAQVFAHYLDRTGADLEKALLRYNGCVNGSNTPNCHQYPSRVLAHADEETADSWRGQGAASP